MAKRKRPTYSQAVAQRILERLAAGESLQAVCRSKDMPSEPTVSEWIIHNHEGFADHYARARNKALDVMAAQVIAIADGKDPDCEGDVQRDRLRFDARRWYLSKLAPKRYGDKLAVEHAGADGGPIQAELRGTMAIVMNDPAAMELLNQAAQRLDAARNQSPNQSHGAIGLDDGATTTS